MKNAARITATILLAGGIIWAQSLPVIATVQTDDSGKKMVALENLRTSPLTAYAIEVPITLTPSNGGAPRSTVIDVLRDAALSATFKPVPGNGTELDYMFITGASVTIKAALWADGTSLGDSVWIRKLTQQRALALRHVQLAISILEDAQRLNRAAPDIAASARQGEIQATQEQDEPGEAAIAKSYYGMIIREMTRPPERRPNAKPLDTAERIRRAMSALMRARDRALPFQ
ncbi:MAG TPA: hypothetical protein VFW83_03315 [Bryobacteraceae bacterium]|nr:hypothetical protein [Bryobacteraceae bacterium]